MTTQTTDLSWGSEETTSLNETTGLHKIPFQIHSPLECWSPLWIGIDPGLTGAVGGVIQEGLGVSVEDLPVWSDGKKKFLDVLSLRNVLSKFCTGDKSRAFIVLEKSQAMPRDGTVGAFRYGEVYGTIKTLLVLEGYRWAEIPAASWRPKIVGKGDKDASRILASRLFPTLSTFLARKKDHGRAEALLLAEYGRRFFGGRVMP